MRSKGNTNKELFWVSYADLMTALFIVTLSLFILSYKLFKDKEDIVIAKEEKLEIMENQLNAKKEAIQILQNELDENVVLGNVFCFVFLNQSSKLHMFNVD